MWDDRGAVSAVGQEEAPDAKVVLDGPVVGLGVPVVELAYQRDGLQGNRLLRLSMNAVRSNLPEVSVALTNVPTSKYAKAAHVFLPQEHASTIHSIVHSAHEAGCDCAILKFAEGIGTVITT